MNDTEKHPSIESRWDGLLFLPDPMLQHAEFLRAFRHAPVAALAKVLHAAYVGDGSVLNHECEKHARHVRQRIGLTNLETHGYDLDSIAVENARMIFTKLSSGALIYIAQENPEFLRECVVIEGQEHLDSAIARGKGVVISLLHWGLFQGFNTLMASLGYPNTLVASEIPCQYLLKLQAAFAPSRAAMTQIIPVPDPTLLIKCVSALGNRDLLCILPELSEGVNQPRLQVPFLGLTIHAPEGPAFLAGASGAPLLPARVELQDVGKFRLVFDLPMEVQSSSRLHVEEATKRFWRYLQDLILQNPTQWCGWEILDRMQTEPNVRVG